MTTYYIKKGRRYVPILEKDPWRNGEDAWPEGCHLVVCKPGTKTTRFNVEPNDAAFVAAVNYYAEDLAAMIVEASKATMNPTPVTKEQIEAWENLKKTYDGVPCCLRFESAMFIAQKFLNVLREKTNL